MDTTPGPALERPRGRRGARGRILHAAAKLFYEEGINATGMERLTEFRRGGRTTR
ncbi:hypothetical protein AB0L59_25990 [Streptomyces sp. NPDC052109]|uniref:hypothetical protein n=1 Tax=Streptomyces sp. NPDC052109 TaxID=3155527 RepID=UPI003423B145